jgi:hypothetical protein
MGTFTFNHPPTPNKQWWRSTTLKGKQSPVAKPSVPTTATMADLLKPNKFQNDIKQQKQALSVCGIGAHHQSGIAKCRIHILSKGSRAILLHAYVCWPKAISHQLWPLALLYTNYLLNHLPRKDGTSRVSQFSDSTVSQEIQDRHTFSCPIHVLEDPLQTAGGEIPKWNPHVCLGIYLGQSLVHASTVGLILNPMTGHVSTQFHVIFDDDFSD